MFKTGDRIHTHDGKVHRVRKDGTLPPLGRRRGRAEMPRIRGFIRGELVDVVTGQKQTGDWHENVITTYGHGLVIRNFVGIVSTATSGHATVMSDIGLARFWGIGYHTAASGLFSTQSALDSSEYGLHQTGGVSRATVSAGTQALSGTWSLSQSFQYASSQLANGASINAVAQYANSSVGAGSALSIATFASSTKGTNQALNLTYNWVFTT